MQLTRLKQLRNEMHYTQKQLAEFLNTTQSQISKYETDSSTLSADVLKMYADFFNVSADYILELTDVRNYSLSCTNSRLEDCIFLFNQIDTLDQNIIIGTMSSMVKEPRNQKKKISNTTTYK